MSEGTENTTPNNPDTGSSDTSSTDASGVALSSAVAKAAKLQAKLDKIESDNKAARAKAEADKAAADGRAAEALAKATEQLNMIGARVQEYEKRDRDEAEAIFKKLPEAVQKRTELLRDKFNDPGEWLAYMRTEESALPQDMDEVVNKGLNRGTDTKKRDAKKYKVANKEWLEDKAGIDVDEPMHIEGSNFEINSDGSRRWYFPIKGFLKRLNTVGGQKLTKAAYEARQVSQVKK